MVLPFGKEMFGKLPNEAAVADAMSKQEVESGTYIVPHCDCDVLKGSDEEAKAAILKRHREGPLMKITYRKEGINPTCPLLFAIGFGHCVVSSLLMAVLLALAAPGLRNFPVRVLFVVLVGAFASFAVTLADPVWYHHPWKFALLKAGFETAGWVPAGAVLGLLVRPRSA
jgi:hypothetical protein